MIFKKYRKVLFAAIILFLLSFLLDLLSPGKYSIKGVVHTIQNNLLTNERDFNNFCDPVSIKALVDDSVGEKQIIKFINKNYYIFVYKENDLSPLLWNTQFVTCDSSSLKNSSANFITRFPNGWYVVKKTTVSISLNRKFLVVALFPVKHEYYVTNNYLHNSFNEIAGIEDRFFISKTKTPYAIVNTLKQPLFYLAENTVLTNSFNNSISILFKIFSIFLIFFFIHHYAKNIADKNGIQYGGLFLFSTILLLRVLSYVFPFPFNFKQFELFSPSVYGSDFILRSLGDLLINVFLIEWLLLFSKDYLLKKKIKYPPVLYKKIAITILISICMLCSTILCASTLNSLISDSKISFDVLNFFSLNRYSIIGLIILCGISTVYFFTMQILLHLVRPIIRENVFIPLIIIISCSLLILYLLLGNVHFVFYFFLIGWMLIFIFLLNNKFLHSFKTKIISANLIFWIFFFSVSITSVIISENNRKELENRKHYLENIADKTDPSGERMMSITLSNLKDDYLPQIFNRFSIKDQNYYLKDSLLHENLPGYLNRFETKIYTFDASGNSLFNSDSTSLNTLNAIIETQSHATSVADLFYYDVSFERFNYITRKIVRNENRDLLGFLIIVASPKRYKSGEIYPQLFNKGNSDAIENSPLYSYAIYNNRNLINSYNDYPFPTHLSSEINFYSNFFEKNVNGYSELWYRVSKSKLVVITKPDNLNLEAVTLFAYLFCSFLAVITLLNLLILLIKSKFNFHEVLHNIQLTVRNQVHGTIILISIISFIIIGVTTILFFVNRYNKNDHEKLSRTINSIQNDILNSTDSSFNFSASLINNTSKKDSLELIINRIADIHESDLNLYDLKGELRISSLAFPYNKGILGNLMDPLAYYHLNKIKDAQYFRTQKIGELEYLNNYMPLKNKKGIDVGYINIPYFESQSKLYEEISNFLITIINLNAFIFLIAGILAFFITNRITNSFALISERMRAVNLGKTNELIKWHRTDEIGELVKEYNRMVLKLEESAQDLARSEREGAWREMARQVAHEIKNPLTPMKLNLQYLQMAIDSNSPNVIDISLYVTKILVEQIDHLSQIASDFSQFANINHSHNQLFDLNETINKLYLLYAGNNELNIELDISADKCMIYADKTQVQRLFTNLIQNAVQSIPENRKAQIKLTSDTFDKVVLIGIKDNGIGIPDNMKSKIFTPNFTTKSSGTGLGLAMCKGIVEKIGGKIWFETTLQQGTTFFVEIPLEIQ